MKTHIVMNFGWPYIANNMSLYSLTLKWSHPVFLVFWVSSFLQYWSPTNDHLPVHNQPIKLHFFHKVKAMSSLGETSAAIYSNRVLAIVQLFCSFVFQPSDGALHGILVESA